MKPSILFLLAIIYFNISSSQETSILTNLDSTTAFHPDSSLRIIDLNPNFSVHVDSVLNYQFQINKNSSNYYWYLKNAPIGLKIQKESGILNFKADRSYFLSGRLKYDVNYNVMVGVQNLNDPKDKIDTNFSVVFFNTEIIPSRVKPTVNGTIYIDEGETVIFKVLCEAGSFPIDNIITLTSSPIKEYTAIQKCGDEFKWTPGYDIAKESDSAKVKIIHLQFIGSNKFLIKDTTSIRLVVRDALNYPIALEEHQQASKNVERYVLQLKYTFLQLDKRLKRTKNTRTTFDLTSASTSLTGTILSTSSNPESVKTGKVLPSIGLALVPIKEATVPSKAVDQNQAASIRTAIKRLEYMLSDNIVLGQKDSDIVKKTTRLKEELKQTQIQLIDVPVELTNDLSEEELNRYFNSPKVNKKYRLKKR